MNPSLADAIDALLPQTQCAKCGYPGCRPYAEALADGRADLNQCPPGGAEGIAALTRLLGRAAKPLNPANGIEAPRAAALIDEARCIGCMLCIRACPVDAIVGAPRRMHTVLTQFCTGCELCVAPCPVDCIAMIDLAALAEAGNRHAAALAAQPVAALAPLNRRRFEQRRARLARE
ncbi:MAG TPA: RnfABCDGE type electron transport complex subunit B, partial [Burkholderiales bacterium]|nr:RnfABCDGE type electron transport complex subunit B [Burkholderiales bacterium]